MKRIIISAALFVAALISAPLTMAQSQHDSTIQIADSTVRQQVELGAEALEAVNTILSRYMPWQNVTFNGKVRSDRLPMSPTVRIYAENGTLLQISLRAPLIGEIGRAEITPTEALVVNRWKKTYFRESMDNITSTYPHILSDIQNLLLGRVVLLGSGVLSLDNLNEVELVKADNDEWAIVPRQKPVNGKLNYGYITAPGGRTEALYAEMEGRPESLAVTYEYVDNAMDMIFDLKTSGGSTRAMLDFTSVRWGGERMAPINVNNGYTRMSVQEFLKNLK